MIHPDFKNKVYETLSVPLGLAWMSAYLKRNSSVIVDCYDFAKNPKQLAEFEEKSYDILFVQLHSQETLKENLKWLEIVKKKRPQTIIVVGGIAVDLNTREILSNDFIDIASLGEGEETTFELCQAIEKKAGIQNVKGIAYKNTYNQVVYTIPRPINDNIDSLPLPDREGFGIDYPQWTIITARGCPFKCRFCSMPQIYNRVRYRKIHKVYEEIYFLYNKYNMRKFYIADDTFTLSRERVIEFCKLLINDKRKVEWTCVTRADRIDEELLQYMKSAGCREISCGIESANTDIQLLIGKNLNIGQIKKNLLIAKKIGIRVRCSFIFGLPGETKNHIRNSIDFMKDLMPNEIQIYPYVPYNGTEFMEDFNRYKINYNSIEFKKKKNLLDPFVETDKLSKSDIIQVSKICIDEMRNLGYVWIPFDAPAKKQRLEYVIMTEFAPIQILC